MGPVVTQSVEAHTVRLNLPRDMAAHGSRRPARPSRLDSLTGLRFFAAGIVFLHHAFELTTGTLREALTAVFGHGRAGVSFFFLLSGFVLAWSMQPGDRATSFWRRRAARLWPAYAVATLAGYLVSRFWDGRYFSLERLAANLAMVQAWIPAKDWYFSVNSVNWSLSVEAFFYLTFPLYASSIMRMRVRSAVALAGVLLGGIGLDGARLRAGTSCSRAAGSSPPPRTSGSSTSARPSGSWSSSWASSWWRCSARAPCRGSPWRWPGRPWPWPGSRPARCPRASRSWPSRSCRSAC